LLRLLRTFAGQKEAWNSHHSDIEALVRPWKKQASPRYTMYSMNIAHQPLPIENYQFSISRRSANVMLYMNCRILISTIILSCFTSQRYWFCKIYHHF